jgi:hypothetical protein
MYMRAPRFDQPLTIVKSCHSGDNPARILAPDDNVDETY